MADPHSEGSPFPTHTLANGLRIVAQPMLGVESLALGFCVATGAGNEEPYEAGASHFIDGLAFQGTALRDTRALTEAFEDLGARRDASTGSELFWYAAQALGRHMEALVPLMAEVVRFPRFDPIEAEKVRDPSAVCQDVRVTNVKMAQPTNAKVSNPPMTRAATRPFLLVGGLGGGTLDTGRTSVVVLMCCSPVRHRGSAERPAPGGGPRSRARARAW